MPEVRDIWITYSPPETRHALHVEDRPSVRNTPPLFAAARPSSGGNPPPKFTAAHARQYDERDDSGAAAK
eukprot:gene12419-5675_t